MPELDLNQRRSAILGKSSVITTALPGQPRWESGYWRGDFMWLKKRASRHIFFQGDEPAEAYKSTCNQSRDQIYNTWHEVNLVFFLN